ncbi:MAG: hypothetical protein JKY65_25600 [Planctomycetes bacterium]|nr:hypothetical protein [Planctomycetota bacterium]
MSDQKLREFERRYQESGEASDEADFLREAVRVGRIEERLLGIACDLGYPPARLAFDTAPITPAEIEDLGQTLRERWGHWELVNFSAALARRLVPSEETESEIGRDVRAALECVAAWLEQPRWIGLLYHLSRWHHSIEELEAWAGAPAWSAIQHTIWTLTDPRPRRVDPKTRRANGAPRCAFVALGLASFLEVVSEVVTPRLYRL